MLSFKTLTVASAALTLVSGANAGMYPIHKRNQEPSQPSCTDFTPFVYAGCFAELASPAPLTLLYTGPRDENMTVERCVAFCKGNDYQYAGLEYYSECFCGATVNGPQVAESECDAPCTGDSSELCGSNMRLNIYQDPTFPKVDNSTITDYEALGCYSEGTNGRSLAWRQEQIPSDSMTIETCLFACKNAGFSFAGLEYAQECYCGVVLGNGTAPVDASQCDMPCTGDSTETCGGRGTLNLFVAKDLESSQPCEGGSSSSSSSYVVTSTTVSSSSSSSTSSYVSTTSSYSSTTSTSASSSTSSSVSSTKSSTSSTSSKPSSTSTSTTKTASLCTSTTTISPTPTCEYKCGSWCSTPLPPFSDSNSCWSAFSSCTVQIASCFLHAGFPESMDCFKFSSWCQSVSTYCQSYCPGGNCNKSGCKSKYPPQNPPSLPSPTISTSVYTCSASSTPKPSSSTSKPSSTSCVPVPTQSNICKQPHNPGAGYSSTSPVGAIPLPCLTCNNVYSSYTSGYPFKLYTFADTNKCPSYPRNNPYQGCKDACDNQYNSCLNTYAQGCRNNKRGDTYSSASQKCQNQWKDCYSANSGVNPAGRCGSWNSGWSK